MRIAVVLFAVGLVAVGCQESEASETLDPVAPLQVEVGTGADVEALRARVAELEEQLAQCQGTATELVPAPDPIPGATPTTPTAVATPGGTRSVAIPRGVDVPAEAPEATDATETGENTTAESTPSAPRTTRRSREPSLLGALLGEEERPRQRSRERNEEEEPSLPNPASILFGE